MSNQLGIFYVIDSILDLFNQNMPADIYVGGSHEPADGEIETLKTYDDEGEKKPIQAAVYFYLDDGLFTGDNNVSADLVSNIAFDCYGFGSASDVIFDDRRSMAIAEDNARYAFLAAYWFASIATAKFTEQGIRDIPGIGLVPVIIGENKTTSVFHWPQKDLIKSTRSVYGYRFIMSFKTNEPKLTESLGPDEVENWFRLQILRREEDF